MVLTLGAHPFRGGDSHLNHNTERDGALFGVEQTPALQSAIAGGLLIAGPVLL